ncbi:unnamed protein product, partial [Didymodactylos carnosus]
MSSNQNDGGDPTSTHDKTAIGDSTFGSRGVEGSMTDGGGQSTVNTHSGASTATYGSKSISSGAA